jgi:K(+)-stimulated pyrophosphate-energized sodium pump
VESALGGASGAFNLSVDKPNVLVGVMIGAAVVFYFSGRRHGRRPRGRAGRL